LRVLLPTLFVVIGMVCGTAVSIQTLFVQRHQLLVSSQLAQKLSLIDEIVIASKEAEGQIYRIAMLGAMQLSPDDATELVADLQINLVTMTILAGEIQRQFEDVAAVPPELRERVTQYKQVAEQAAAVVLENPTLGVMFIRSSEESFEALTDTLSAVRASSESAIAALERSSEIRTQKTLWILVSIVLALAIGGPIVAIVTGTRWLTRPLLALSSSVIGVATGNLDHSVPELSRTDEIGKIAAAVDILRRGAIEKREVDEALKDSETRLRNIVNNATNLFYSHTPDHQLIYISPQTREFFDCEPEEALGLWTNLATDHPINAVGVEITEQAIRTGVRQPPYELELAGKKGRKIRVEVREMPVTHNGKTEVIVGSLTDITARKKAEEDQRSIEAQLRQGQRLESLGVMASGVAHEINNPLMGMINYADLIADRVQDAKLREFATGIMSEGQRVATIVRSLLSFSRQDSEEHSPARLIDIIDASLTLVGSLLRKDQIIIQCDIPEGLPLVKCRGQQIQQVMINLLTNARAALNERYTDYDENKLVRITSRLTDISGASWIRTTVEDHGVGIPEKIAHKIFDPFFSTKSRHEGTGLGLSISYGIVQEHHGELTVESVPGEYTRFHMDLLVDNGWTHNGAKAEE